MREFLVHPPEALTMAMPVISLLIFVAVSILVTVHLLTDRRRDHHRRMERLALEDEGTLP